MARTRPADDPQLGPFLFERKCPKTAVMVVGLILTAFGFTFLMVEAINVNGGQAWGSVVGMPVLVLAGIALPAGIVLIAISWKDQKVLRFHQRGIVRVSKRRSQPLPYEQIVAVQYQAVRMHHHGIYTGTNLKMELTPAPETNYTPFKFSGKLKEKRKGFLIGKVVQTDELEAIHAALSERIAAEMLARIANGESVQWTKRTVLRSDGLVIGTELLPRENFGELQLKDGRLTRKRPGKWLSEVVSIGSEPNFLAGWIALCKLA